MVHDLEISPFQGREEGNDGFFQSAFQEEAERKEDRRQESKVQEAGEYQTREF